MLPNGMAGAEFHHKHRVLYKSLSVHYDHLYKCIGSDGAPQQCKDYGIYYEQLVMEIGSSKFYCCNATMLKRYGGNMGERL
jgi:hypothetical protein